MSHEWNCTCVRCERERDWLDAVDEPEAPRAADEDMCGGRNTMTRSAPGDLAGYAD
jgi:hypothetical protein